MINIPTIFKAHDIKNIVICHTADEALTQIKKLYQDRVDYLKKTVATVFENSNGNGVAMEPSEKVTYPFLGIEVAAHQLNVDARISYGAASDAGVYGATLTRPDLFEDYYLEQIHLLIKHHKVPVFVGESNKPIPLPFAIWSSDPVASTPAQVDLLQKNFVLPNLSKIDDDVANSTQSWDDYEDGSGIHPLTLFDAGRVDMSLHRLQHYTGTSIDHFQRFILLTNYQRYIDEFLEYGHRMLGDESEYESLVEPGDYITTNKTATGERAFHLPQMPAYHLTRPDKQGITFINIGVGPSNAKTITDHLAVLRPHCWLMLGHCAGLRRSQWLGDYVLAHAYVRADHVLEDDLPSWVPIPPIAEVQVALQKAVAKITGQDGIELKNRMRTGTVFTTDNRNWELRSRDLFTQFQQSRAIAVDMESATVAANGFRFRVPYGTLLCVSDKPIHGEVKMRGMANEFYRQRVAQHLQIGLEAINILRKEGTQALHSRKLRGFDDPPFR